MRCTNQVLIVPERGGMGIAIQMLQAIVRGYKTIISPILPAACRYFPTCSEYACEALAVHGVIRGSKFALCRILRCHPWGGSGIDPVPPLPKK